MPVEYAHALLEAQRNGVDADSAVTELVAALKRDGKLKALPAIKRELEHIAAQKKSHTPTLTLAREKDEQDARTQLALHVGDAAAKSASTTVDDTLIGGWRYGDSQTLIDASYKHALIKLYQRILTT